MTTDMRYFQNSGKTYGYDNNDPREADSIAAALKAGWIEVTGNWPPAPTAAQQLLASAAALLAAPVTITSTSTPALDGSYSITGADQLHIQAEVQSIMLNGTFADGSSAVAWPDAAAGVHTFTVVQFKAFATAIGSFVAACYKVLNGSSTTLPSAALTIA
jgi:hypothetical protein